MKKDLTEHLADDLRDSQSLVPMNAPDIIIWTQDNNECLVVDSAEHVVATYPWNELQWEYSPPPMDCDIVSFPPTRHRRRAVGEPSRHQQEQLAFRWVDKVGELLTGRCPALSTLLRLAALADLAP